MKRVLLAGATGYLGQYLLNELIKRNYFVRVVVRNPKKIESFLQAYPQIECLEREVTDKESLYGCCDDIDIVISTVGITHQKDGLTYMDVDYQANKNLLDEALRAKVKKFMYVSAFKADKMRNILVCDAKEKFVDALKSSGLDYCVIRPNGFFADMVTFYMMAKKGGRVYMIGKPERKSNPIHGADLAEEMLNVLETDCRVLEIGGPQVLTQQEVGALAFSVLEKAPKYLAMAEWKRRMLLRLSSLFLPKRKLGPIQFFLTMSGQDFIAPEYGHRTLKEFFEQIKNEE